MPSSSWRGSFPCRHCIRTGDKALMQNIRHTANSAIHTPCFKSVAAGSSPRCNFFVAGKPTRSAMPIRKTFFVMPKHRTAWKGSKVFAFASQPYMDGYTKLFYRIPPTIATDFVIFARFLYKLCRYPTEMLRCIDGVSRDTLLGITNGAMVIICKFVVFSPEMMLAFFFELEYTNHEM